MHTVPASRNALDGPTAEALAGFTRLQELGLRRLAPWRDRQDGRPLQDDLDLNREIAAGYGAAVAALPPWLRLLKVGEVGCCAEGAALVAPPGRAQRLEVVRCDGLNSALWRRPTGRVRTGSATVEDVRAFLRWLGPGVRIGTLVVGGCMRWAGD